MSRAKDILSASPGVVSEPRRKPAAAIAPRKLNGPVQLSFQQERLWFLEQLDIVGAAYNIALAFQINGALDPGILARSFAELVRRFT